MDRSGRTRRWLSAIRSNAPLGERIRQPDEVSDAERLAARPGRDACALQLRLTRERLDRIAQRLSPLSEGRRDDACEQRFVDDGRPRLAQRRQACDG